MNRQEIETVVIEVLTSVFKCPIARDCARENFPLWDSLKHIEVVFAIEDELNVEFDEDTLPELDSVESIIKAALVLRHAT